MVNIQQTQIIALLCICAAGLSIWFHLYVHVCLYVTKNTCFASFWSYTFTKAYLLHALKIHKPPKISLIPSKPWIER